MDSHNWDSGVVEPELGDSAIQVHVRKRKKKRVPNNDNLAVQEKLVKKIMLPLTKPSYVLGLGPNNLRSEHRARLRYLFRRLVKQQNWVEASGVVSAYLQATVKDKSPFENQLKYSVWTFSWIAVYSKSIR